MHQRLLLFQSCQWKYSINVEKHPFDPTACSHSIKTILYKSIGNKLAESHKQRTWRYLCFKATNLIWDVWFLKYFPFMLLWRLIHWQLNYSSTATFSCESFVSWISMYCFHDWSKKVCNRYLEIETVRQLIWKQVIRVTSSCVLVQHVDGIHGCRSQLALGPWQKD